MNLPMNGLNFFIIHYIAYIYERELENENHNQINLRIRWSITTTREKFINRSIQAKLDFVAVLIGTENRPDFLITFSNIIIFFLFASTVQLIC